MNILEQKLRFKDRVRSGYVIHTSCVILPDQHIKGVLVKHRIGGTYVRHHPGYKKTMKGKSVKKLMKKQRRFDRFVRALNDLSDQLQINQSNNK